ncbi:uncharacterized protein LY89DRAFT_729181 [Mollisia scopiformis]|uniref:Peptidase S8/S53 domain-containing protein n=1 Tax=Mollisia scopiformis TaxID=149040 RepID=A0A194XNE3_MOLSC|nr:uncharacterized protein LY89DRAFT_729181 [Mollisia scopiformis]KUJ21671.1 hypothetical protein LY89DRAFT_729181 [Mollisia scopiformis]
MANTICVEQSTTSTSTTIPAQTTVISGSSTPSPTVISASGCSPSASESTATPLTSQAVASSNIIVIGTDTVTLPILLSTTTLNTDGTTLTLVPTSTSSSGQTITTDSSLLVWGTNTVTIPTSLTTTVTLITSGETFTFSPTPASSSSASLLSSNTSTLPNGSSISAVSSTITALPNSSSASLLRPNGTSLQGDTSTSSASPNTTTLPNDSSASLLPSTILTSLPGVSSTASPLSTTSTYLPNGSSTSSSILATSSSSSSSSSASPLPLVTITTLPDGQTVTSSSDFLFWGTHTFPLPTSLTVALTLTTDGETFTFLPSSSNSPPERTLTLPDGQTVTSNSGFLFWGTNTLPVPTDLTSAETLTTDGETFTFQPTATSGTITSSSSSSPQSASLTETTSTSTVLPLKTFSIWPPNFTLFPVSTTVSQPKSTDKGGVIPSSAWFFSICISWDINIGGWELDLPPGIYPAGPPPGIEFPPGISISGTLPPWPPITIGNDNIPTYSSEPSSCERETTASLCPTTSSIGVTVSAGVTLTTTASTSTCSTISGCNVQNSATTTTEACTTPEVVTDIWMSCSFPGTATTSGVCQTASSSLVSGCGVTPTTVSCTSGPASSAIGDNVNVRRAGLSLPACDFGPDTQKYVIYPKDGTNTVATQAIIAVLADQTFGIDQTTIYTSNTVTMGINYWLVPLSDMQIPPIAASLAPYIASFYMQNAKNTPDPTISWLPNVYKHLVFVSQQSPVPMATLGGFYFFDGSIPPGQDISVYILDSGASLGHKEFDLIRANTRWITVGEDVNPNGNGQMIAPAEDDSQTDPNSEFFLFEGTWHVHAKPRLGKDHVVACGSTNEDYIEGLSRVCDDLAAQGITQSSTTTSVLLLALLFPRTIFVRDGIDKSAGFSGRMQALLAKAVSQGVFPITGSGNGGATTIDGWPANFGGTANGQAVIPQLLVVGSVAVTENEASNGQISPSCSRDAAQNLPHIYAPGLFVTTADGNFLDGTEYNTDSSGTSDAAALTAGLAAYYLVLANSGSLKLADMSPAGLKAYITSSASSWARDAGPGASTIWNGAKPALDQETCAWVPPGTAAKRDSLGFGLWDRQATGSDAPVSIPVTATCGVPAALSSYLATESIALSGIVSSTITGSGITTSTSVTVPSLSQPSNITNSSTSIASSIHSSTFSTVMCNSATPVPGQCGNEGCVYVIATEVQNALCTTDYCYCGGNFGPLLTTSMSGSVSSGCDYTTVPTCINCASASCTSTMIQPTTTTTSAIASSKPTVAPLTLGPQQCNSAADFPGHKDIEPDTLNYYIGFACAGSALTSDTISSTSNPTTPINVEVNGVYYYLAITWVEGCTNTVSSQHPYEPIPGNTDVTCGSLFENDYKNCDNTGVGGSIVVGCLQYTFTPANYGVTS